MDAEMEKELNTVKEALKSNRFDPVIVVEDVDKAKQAVLDMIPENAAFVPAGSTTVSQLGLTEQLMKGRKTDRDSSKEKTLTPEELMRRSGGDVLVCSSNAVTLDGKLVNIDATGNRVGNMIFGPKKVILVIGMNKIVRDVDEALDRVKHIIAPYHAKIIKRKTPCAKTGQCSDCNAPDRICNVTTIIEKKPSMTDTAVILVGQDLGLGWNPDWDESRIERILSVYRQEIEKMKRARGAS